MSSSAGEAEQLQILADAGISAEDVDLVVRHRLQNRRQDARTDAGVLHRAEGAMTRLAQRGDELPQYRDRGAQLTDDDLWGSWRRMAVAIAHAEAVAEQDDTAEDVAHTRSDVLGGMCRREAEGRHEDNLLLIERARPRRGGSIGSTR